jgi:hypothetical protein
VTTDPADRARIAQLADALIPGGEGMPSASAAGATGAALDQVLAIREDLVEPLGRAVAQPGPAEAAVRALHGADREAFEALAFALSCTYAMSDDVRAALGYPGQVPYPISVAGDPDLDELLTPVFERGFREVTTPTGERS